MSQQEPYVIALSVASRGYAPATESSTYRAAELAVETCNNDPDYPHALELQVFDDEGDLERTSALAHDIVGDPRILGVVGPTGSSEALANAPIFAEAGLAQVSPCASHPDLCHEDNETFFRLNADGQAHAQTLADLIADYFGADSIAVFKDDSDWADQLTERLIAATEGREIAVSHTVRFPVDQESFEEGELGEAVDAVVDAEDDLIFFAIHPTPGEPLASTLRSRGVTAPFLSMNAFAPILPGGTDDQPVYQTEAGADWNERASATGFRDRYCERYEPDPHYSPESYDAVQLLAAAIASDDEPTRATVRSYLGSVSGFEGVSGPITFDETGERLDPDINLYQIHDDDGERDLEHLGQASELV